MYSGTLINASHGLTGITGIAEAQFQTLILTDDGIVHSLGAFGFGNYTVPPGLADVTYISADLIGAAALRSDGRVVSWGDEFGPEPVIPNLTNVEYISVGANLANIALTKSGEAYSWGRFGNTSLLLTNIMAVSAGMDCVLTLTRDGEVVGRGDNHWHQLEIPPQLANVRSVAAGRYHAAAVNDDRTVVVWGSNFQGEQLPPPGLSNVASVFAIGNSTLALKRDGRVIGFGGRSDASVLDGLKAVRTLATAFPYAALVGSVVDFGNRDLQDAGSLREFILRNNESIPLTIKGAQLGGVHRGDFELVTLGMASVLAPGDVTRVWLRFKPTAVGPRTAHLLVTSSDEEQAVFEVPLTGTGFDGPRLAAFFGANTQPDDEIRANADDQAFPDTIAYEGVSTRIITLHNLGTARLENLRVSLGGRHRAEFTLENEAPTALDPGEKAILSLRFAPAGPATRRAFVRVASGDGSTRPLQIDIIGNGLSPRIEVEKPGGIPLMPIEVAVWTNGVRQAVPGGLIGAQQVVAGDSHLSALTSDGRVVSWLTFSGPLLQSPKVLEMTDIKQIAAGYNFTVGIKRDGTVTGVKLDSLDPIQVPATMTNIQQIAAKNTKVAMVRTDGTLLIWGDGEIPPGLKELAMASIGLNDVAVLKRDGSVVSWTYFGSTLVGLTNGLSHVRSVISFGTQSVILFDDGSTRTWPDGFSAEVRPYGGFNDVESIFVGNPSLAVRRNGQVVDRLGGSIGLTNMITAEGNQTQGILTIAGLTGSSVDLGEESVGIPGAPLEFTIKNAVPAPLRVTNIVVLGEQASDFVVDTEGTQMQLPVGAGPTHFRVRFSPTGQGFRRATLRLRSNDMEQGVFEVRLTGTGINGGPPNNGVPVAELDTLNRLDFSSTLTVSASTLLANDHDPDGDPLSVVELRNPLPAGARVELSDGLIKYIVPSPTVGNGSFEYRLSDGPGGHITTGKVVIVERSLGANSGPRIMGFGPATGGVMEMRLSGIPGSRYGLQYSDALVGPANWHPFDPPVGVQAPVTGLFSLTDPKPPVEARFYRVVRLP